MSPTLRCLSLASLALMAIVPSRAGAAPAMYLLRLNRGGAVEKTSVGAPPVVTDLPLTTTAPLPSTAPAAAATPFTARTWSSSATGSAPPEENTSPPEKATLRVMLTSVPTAAFSKIERKPLLIWSVMT